MEDGRKEENEQKGSKSHSVPVAVSHTITLVSLEAVASIAPSGEKEQAFTSFKCPMSLW